MTFVGKILVVVILVLAVCVAAFTGGVYAVQTNWKKKFDDSEKMLGDLRNRHQTELSAKDDELKTLTEAKTQVEAERDQFRGDLQVARARIPQLTSELQTTKAELNESRTALTIMDQDIKARRAEAERMRARNKELHEKVDEALAKIVSLEDDKFNLEREKKDMNTAHNALLDQFALAKQILAKNRLELDPREVEGELPQPPAVEGYVLNTRQSSNDRTQLVELSIGSDDGFLEGHDLHVYRNNGRGKYLGKLRLITVTPDRSVGAVIERARNGIISRGDHVTPKL